MEEKNSTEVINPEPVNIKTINPIPEESKKKMVPNLKHKKMFKKLMKRFKSSQKNIVTLDDAKKMRKQTQINKHKRYIDTKKKINKGNQKANAKSSKE